MSTDSEHHNITNIVKMLSNRYEFDYTEAMEHLTLNDKSSVENIIDADNEQETMTIPTLFNHIKSLVKEHITKEQILSYRTDLGNTQVTERTIISVIKQILDNENICYTEAGSQQSKDFRNVGGIGLNVEIKKTDSTSIYFNDTCPSSDIYYIIFVTGGKSKSIKPQLLFLNGNDFVKESPWIYEYQRKLDLLKDEYARGTGKKKLTGIMSVYPRPTYRADIRIFLDSSKNL